MLYKLLPVEQHFCLADHDFIEDAKFTIIDKIEKIPSPFGVITLHPCDLLSLDHI